MSSPTATRHKEPLQKAIQIDTQVVMDKEMPYNFNWRKVWVAVVVVCKRWLQHRHRAGRARKLSPSCHFSFSSTTKTIA